MDLLKTISILGISFQFFSFWLGAPEILGSEWLQKTEVILKKLISQIPSYILLIAGGFIGAFFSISKQNYVIVILLIAAFLFISILNKKIERYLERKISEPLLNNLIIKQSLRFTLLKIAAVFFTFGFLLQILAVFMQ